jgi:cell division protein FtsI/penicillin-binding protein 2
LRGDAKEFGETLESGEAALVVIGESRVEEQLDKALTHAEKSIEKEVDADGKEFETDLEAAEAELAKQEAAAS